MEKRVLLAVFLSFLVLFIYQSFVVGPIPSEQISEQSTNTETSLQELNEPITPSTVPTPSPGGATNQEVESNIEVLVSDLVEREIVVETAEISAIFTNRGAELLSWVLKDYEGEDGRAVDVIPQELPAGWLRPFSVSVADNSVDTRLREALFQPSAARLSVDNRPLTLTFEYQDTSGLTARKAFHFGEAPYVVEVSASVEQNGQPMDVTLHWGPGLSGVQESSGIGYRQGSQAIFFGQTYENGILGDEEVSRLSPSTVANEPVYEGQFSFVGIDNHYFLGAALPMGEAMRFGYELISVPASVAGGTETNFIAYDASLADASSNLRFFIGPKDFDILASVNSELVRAIDFGWLTWLIVPLHQSLKWIYGFSGNWGWSIIILTILINALMFPLRHKSVVSMRKMQELQPEIKAIQKRYSNLKATDPAKKKMNSEIMNLYRERGVNPAGGCLPMLLTMPVLFAFYRLLSVSIEIRGAPFVLWITDLAVYDPLYVTPIVMGATMVFQQKMTPSTAEPMQQKIMMIMPVVFTFMFIWAPSGLVLYWLTSNVWGIGQQLVTNRIIGPPVVRTVRPPAERRLKRAGHGKTEMAKENDGG